MSTFGRYLVFQLPAWTIATGVALGFDQWTTIPRGWIGSGFALYVIKDFAMYPFVRSAYEASVHEPGGELIGAPGEVVVALCPEGWVELRHERWRARPVDPELEAAGLEAGTRVVVRALEGQVLRVEPLAGEPES